LAVSGPRKKRKKRNGTRTSAPQNRTQLPRTGSTQNRQTLFQMDGAPKLEFLVALAAELTIAKNPVNL
jgi:hypothetical protein